MSFPIIPDSEDKLACYEQATTPARFVVALQLDPRYRSDWVEGIQHLSLVDLMGVWGIPKETKARLNRQVVYAPRQIWNDEKKRLLKIDPELSESFLQLKMVAQDGKRRVTEAASLKTALYILQIMNTPATLRFKRHFADIMDSMAMPEWEYRKHFAMLDTLDKNTSITKFLKEVGATYFNGEDTERLD